MRLRNFHTVGYRYFYATTLLWGIVTTILRGAGTTILWVGTVYRYYYILRFPLSGFLSHTSWHNCVPNPRPVCPRLPSQLDYKIDVLERNPKSVSLKCVACTLRRPHLLQSTVACLSLSLNVCKARCVRGGQTMTPSPSANLVPNPVPAASQGSYHQSLWRLHAGLRQREQEREIWHRATGNEVGF